MNDWVAWASYLSVAFLIVMFVYFVIKARKLIYKKDDK